MMILLSQGRTTTSQGQKHYWPAHLVEFPQVFVRQLPRVMA